MRIAAMLILLLLVAACGPAGARDRHVPTEVPGYWLTDLEAAFAIAGREGKPLLVSFRCDP